MPEETKVTSAVSDNTGATIRNTLVWLAGVLLGRQLISEEFYQQFLSGIPFIVGLLMLILPWAQSYWEKWKRRDRTETLVEKALDAEAGTSKAELVAANPEPPGIIEKVTGSGKTALPMVILLAAALALGAATLAVSGCGSFGRAVNLESAPETAAELKSLAYADRAFVLAAQTFDTTMTLAEDLRARRQIDDPTWRKIDAAQKQVNKWSPKVAAGLEYWRTFGSRSSFDHSYNAMMLALSEIQETTDGVRR